MMKNNIEDLMKKALEGHELPYQEGAWDSFQKRMDAKYAKHSYKWWISSAAIIAVAISSVYFLIDNQNQKNLHVLNKVEKEKSISKSKGQNRSTKFVTSLNDAIGTKNSTFTGSEKNSITDFNLTPDLSSNEIIVNNHKEFTSTINYNSTFDQNESNSNDLNIVDENQFSDLTENFPTFSDKCKNESIFVENKNPFELILKTPSGREIGIESNSKSEINLNETGFYQLGYLKTNGSFKEKSKFKVFGATEVNLNLDGAVTYKNGLPIVNAESNSSDDNLIWKINQKAIAKSGKSIEFNLFNKGTYTITVQSKNEFGCESRESKTVQVNEDYNLLAMSAFNPNSLDSRNSAFMPYALKERSTSFRMIILDPDNGGIIFETTEATNPWTGIDRRDGKMVSAQKAYVWKVTLANPEPGEKSEYKGTIVRVP
jgi:hypothetical protein